MSRLMWEPTLDPQELREYYIRRAYGRAAPEMLGFYNISNAYNLLSLGVPRPQQNHADVSDLPEQEVRFTQDADGYAPNVIGIDPNRKIRLVVTGKNPYSCSSQLIIPSLGIVKSLTL